MDAQKKKYGLILKNNKKPDEVKVLPTKRNVFEDDDDDETAAPPTSSNALSASVIRVQKAAEREHERAKAEDPTIFDYDGNYDEIQAIKNEKKEEAKKADKTRESKYAENIMKAHARRQLEQFSREERQQDKERKEEGEMFADKEVFVTGAYRKQQEEVKKYREEEAEEAQFNDMTSVQNQKMWELGIGRTLLNDIARDPTAILKRRKEQKNTRARMESSPSPTRESEMKSKEEPKKSIYSDDEDKEEVEKKDVAPPKKNFENELKPGLNKVTKKATTHAERIKRNFTPTPPSSDGEEDDRRDRRRDRSNERSSNRKSTRERSRERSVKKEIEEEDVKPQIKKLSLKEKLKPKKIDKEARLARLKLILKQRNGPEEIEEMRKRYLERREAGVVQPPL